MLTRDEKIKQIEVLIQKGNARFISRNCCAINARCYEQNRVILNAKEHKEKTCTENHMNVSCVGFTCSRPA